MGILSQILPGVRDLRTPLAVGTLWLIAGWLAYDLATPQLTSNPLATKLIKTADNLDSVSLGLILSSIAYIVGVLLEGIGKWILYFALGLLSIPLMAVIAFGVPLLLGFSFLLVASFTIAGAASSLTAFVSIALISLIIALSFWLNPQPRRTLVSYLYSSLTKVLAVCAAMRVDLVDIAQRIAIPTYVARRNFILSRVDQLLIDRPEVLKKIIEEISREKLRHAVQAVLESRTEKMTVNFALGTQVFSVRDMIHNLTHEQSPLHEAQEFLYTSLVSHPQPRRDFYWRELQLDDMKHVVESELHSVESSFRATVPDLHENYDRLKNEGEFRVGIAAPVGAVTGLAVFLALPASGPSTPIFYAAAVPAAILLILGRLKLEESAGIVVSSIEKGLCTMNKFRLEQADRSILENSKGDFVMREPRDLSRRSLSRRLQWALDRTRVRDRDTAPSVRLQSEAEETDAPQAPTAL